MASPPSSRGWADTSNTSRWARRKSRNCCIEMRSGIVTSIAKSHCRSALDRFNGRLTLLLLMMLLLMMLLMMVLLLLR